MAVPPAAAAPPIARPPVHVAQPDQPPAGEAAAEPAAPPLPPGEGAPVVERPAGAPEISLMFILWAQNPAQRMASVRVGTGTVTIVHEGEFVEGMQVASIRADAVDFVWTGTTFRVHVGPF